MKANKEKLNENHRRLSEFSERSHPEARGTLVDEKEVQFGENRFVVCAECRSYVRVWTWTKIDIEKKYV